MRLYTHDVFLLLLLVTVVVQCVVVLHSSVDYFTRLIEHCNHCICTVFQKNWTLCYFIIAICFDSYEVHENFQKYIGGFACCEYGINVCDSLTVVC